MSRPDPKSGSQGMRAATWSELAKPILYDCRRREIEYSGEWKRLYRHDASGLVAYISRRHADTARLRFVGSGVDCVGARGPTLGMARVVVDGILKACIDLYAPQYEWSDVLYSCTGLIYRDHEIKVEVDGQSGRFRSRSWRCD